MRGLPSARIKNATVMTSERGWSSKSSKASKASNASARAERAATNDFVAEATANCCGPMRASSVAKTSPVARRSRALSIVHADVSTVSSSVHVQGVTIARPAWGRSVYARAEPWPGASDCAEMWMRSGGTRCATSKRFGSRCAASTMMVCSQARRAS